MYICIHGYRHTTLYNSVNVYIYIYIHIYVYFGEAVPTPAKRQRRSVPNPPLASKLKKFEDEVDSTVNCTPYTSRSREVALNTNKQAGTQIEA